MILKQHLDNNIIYFFYIKVYYIMSKLQAWRNSFRLVPDSSAPGQCKKGQTFRGTARNASVEFGSSSTRTFRGYNSHVENGRDGYTLDKHAQLFGHENNKVAQAGVGGDASDVIYFKPIFERFTVEVSSQ
jgi:hypothetical protein